jgi:hypothetical protein
MGKRAAASADGDDDAAAPAPTPVKKVKPAAVPAAAPVLKVSKAAQAKADASAALAEQVGDDNIWASSASCTTPFNAHSMFKNIMEEEPLNVSDGGSQAAFSQSNLSAALKGDESSGRVYLCGGNFFWQNFTWMANHRTPINPGTIHELQRFSLNPMAPPRHLAFQTVFAVETPAEEDDQGALQRISPPEPAFAVHP